MKKHDAEYSQQIGEITFSRLLKLLPCNFVHKMCNSHSFLAESAFSNLLKLKHCFLCLNHVVRHTVCGCCCNPNNLTVKANCSNPQNQVFVASWWTRNSLFVALCGLSWPRPQSLMQLQLTLTGLDSYPHFCIFASFMLHQCLSFHKKQRHSAGTPFGIKQQPKVFHVKLLNSC